MLKLIPDDLKLDTISIEAAVDMSNNPEAVQDYINHLIVAYNARVDDVNEYHMLYNEKVREITDYKTEHKIMARIIHDNGLWTTFLNDDEFLEYLRQDDDMLNLMGDDDAVGE